MNTEKQVHLPNPNDGGTNQQKEKKPLALYLPGMIMVQPSPQFALPLPILDGDPDDI